MRESPAAEATKIKTATMRGRPFATAVTAAARQRANVLHGRFPAGASVIIFMRNHCPALSSKSWSRPASMMRAAIVRPIQCAHAAPGHCPCRRRRNQGTNFRPMAHDRQTVVQWDITEQSTTRMTSDRELRESPTRCGAVLHVHQDDISLAFVDGVDALSSAFLSYQGQPGAWHQWFLPAI